MILIKNTMKLRKFKVLDISSEVCLLPHMVAFCLTGAANGGIIYIIFGI